MNVSSLHPSHSAEDEDHLSSESIIVSSEEYGPVEAVEGDEENGQNYLAN